MTRSEGVALIKQQLGFRTDLDSTIVLNLQLAQIALERGKTKPWFMISETSTAVTEVDESRIALPTDFIQELDKEGLAYIPDDEDLSPVLLKKVDVDILQRNYAGADAGPPEAYDLVGQYFRIFPTPDDVYTIRMIYYAKQTTLDTDVENNWLKEVPHLILGTAGLQVANAVRDAGAASAFGSWIQVGLSVLHGHDTSREMSNASLQMGGPH